MPLSTHPFNPTAPFIARSITKISAFFTLMTTLLLGLAPACAFSYLLANSVLLHQNLDEQQNKSCSI